MIDSLVSVWEGGTQAGVGVGASQRVYKELHCAAANEDCEMVSSIR